MSKRVFLSRPTWIPSSFEAGLKTLMMQLGNLGLEARTLGVSDHPSKAPLDEVIDLMSSCRGAIILGIPQIVVKSGSLKDKEISAPFELATEWNQLEAALAYSSGVPILVVHHVTISRGIFDRGVMNAFLHRVDMMEGSWSMTPDMNGALSA